MAQEIVGWITVNGQHIPLGAGESKEEAINRAIAKRNSETKSSQIAKHKAEADKRNGKSDSNGGGKEETPTFKTATEDKFIKTLTEAKASCQESVRWRVDVHEKGDYEKHGCKLFTSKGGSTVAVTKDGDIISVCANQSPNEPRGAGSRLLEQAVKNGGVKLDSFSGNHGFYTKNGFEPTSWTPFNKEYAPNGWKEGRDKEEPVIFYRYVGKDNVKFGGQDGLDRFLSTVKAYEGDDGYDKAMAYRDSQIKGGKKK